MGCPLSEQTRGIIGADGFARMGRRNAVHINVARGPVVDEEALYRALRAGTIRGASIDVGYSYPTTGEPLPERGVVAAGAAVRGCRRPLTMALSCCGPSDRSAQPRGSFE